MTDFLLPEQPSGQSGDSSQEKSETCGVDWCPIPIDEQR